MTVDGHAVSCELTDFLLEGLFCHFVILFFVSLGNCKTTSHLLTITFSKDSGLDLRQNAKHQKNKTVGESTVMVN